jgi:hypothetical protein
LIIPIKGLDLLFASNDDEGLSCLPLMIMKV